MQAFQSVGVATNATATDVVLPPLTAYVVTVRATNMAGAASALSSKPVLIDVDVPDHTSELKCATDLDPPSAVRVTQTVLCHIVPKRLGRLVVGYPADFNVTGATILPRPETTAYTIGAGGDISAAESLQLPVSFSALPVAGLQALRVVAAGGPSEGRDIAFSPFGFEVASTYADNTSVVECLPQLGAYQGRSIVRVGDAMLCNMSMRQNHQAASALLDDLDATATLGSVTVLASYSGGAVWLFEYVAPSCGTDDTLYFFVGHNAGVMSTPVSHPVHLALWPSASSSLSCESGLQPPSTVRYGEVVNCSLTVRDEVGLGKAVGTDFVITAGVGTVAEVETRHAGASFRFSYTAPTQGFNDTLAVALARAPSATIDGGVVHLDLAAVPDRTSSLECTSRLASDTEVEYGDTLRCQLRVRTNGSATKGVPSDFVVFGNSSGSRVGDLEVADGGFYMVFEYTAPNTGDVDDVNAVVATSAAAVAGSPITMQLLVVGASKLSTVLCLTGLVPQSSIRRGTTAVCNIAMIDRDGDPIKGSVNAFEVSATSGEVSDLRVSANSSRVAEFDYAAPNLVSAATVTAVLELTSEVLENGVIAFDVVDVPDTTSGVSCSSSEVPKSIVRAGGVITCVITPSVGGTRVKAVPGDFTVTSSAISQLGPMQVEDGGATISFTLIVPEDPDLHEIAVIVTLAGTTDEIGSGNPRLDVAHVPDETSRVSCARVEHGTFASDATNDMRGRLVAEFEEIQCDVVCMAGGVAIKALTYDFVASASNGSVGSVVSDSSGHVLSFVYHAPAAQAGAGDVIHVALVATGTVVFAELVSVVPHELVPPYLRCTSFEKPTTSVRIDAQLHCTVYFATPVDLLSPEAGLSIALVPKSVLGPSPNPTATSSAGLAYAFSHTAPAQAGDATLSVGLIGAPETPVDGSPFHADVAGFPTLSSWLECHLGPAFAAEGYLLRDVPVTCVIVPVDDNAFNSPALFTDFDVVANGDVTEVTTPDGGLSLWFNVTTPALGAKFDVTVTLAGGAVPIVNGSVSSELTDELPPLWSPGFPRVVGADKATVTVALQLDEPCLVYVGPATNTYPVPPQFPHYLPTLWCPGTWSQSLPRLPCLTCVTCYRIVIRLGAQLLGVQVLLQVWLLKQACLSRLAALAYSQSSGPSLHCSLRRSTTYGSWRVTFRWL